MESRGARYVGVGRLDDAPTRFDKKSTALRITFLLGP